MRSREIAVFNLEPTSTDFVQGNIFLDIRAVGMELPYPPDASTTRPQERARILGWMAGKRQVDVEPLLERTVQATPDRLADWAKLFMQAQADMERELFIYSTNIPHPFVEAYGQGIAAAIPAAQVLTAGKQMVMYGNTYTHHTQEMNRKKVFTKLEEDGYDIKFAADSFGSAMKAVRKAGNGLLVNFDFHERTFELDRLDWRFRQPLLCSFIAADQPLRQYYDLQNPAHRQELLDHVLGDDPAYVELAS